MSASTLAAAASIRSRVARPEAAARTATDSAAASATPQVMLAGILTRCAPEPPFAGSAAAFTVALTPPAGVGVSVAPAGWVVPGAPIDESRRKLTTASLAAAATSGAPAACWRPRLRW